MCVHVCNHDNDVILASGDPSTSEDKDEEGSTYVYDHRGLKVRRGSLNTDQLKETNSNADQAKISS